MLSVALLTVAWAAGISIPASAAPTKGSLEIVSIADTGSALAAPVQNRPFSVSVRVLDNAGQPMTLTQATTIVLEAAPDPNPGGLTDKPTAVIPRNGSGATISATYSDLVNGVVLTVRATSGVQLAPDSVTVDIALTAVDAQATRGKPLNLRDNDCSVPTSDRPTCGHLLTTGANGPVIMSVGSCVDLDRNPATPTRCRTVGGTTAMVVTVNADIAHSPDDPYSTMILACDKVICGLSGVPRIPVIYTFDNTGDLTETAPACPAKGVLPEGPPGICVDYVQSVRSGGDLYLYVLFDHDIRFSG